MANFSSDPSVLASLSERNARVAQFWLAHPKNRTQPDPQLYGRKALIVDAEDAFTAMLAQQICAIGLDVTRCRCDRPLPLDETWDLIVMGPGPGDPRNTADPRIAGLQRGLRRLLEQRQRFLAVCLSHQILCLELGLPIIKRAVPNQGAQREIDLFGTCEAVGFYNTFVAHCADRSFTARNGMIVDVSRDEESFEVHALRASTFVSFQFHAESLLTCRGVDIIASHVKRVVLG
jgi:phenazine biosynthesis protein phzE